MHILHLITSMHYAGAEQLLANVANVHCGDHKVEIIYFKGDFDLESRLDPRIGVDRVDLGKGFCKRLRAVLQERQPEVLHTHLGHADFLGLWAARGLPLRRFSTMHNVHFKWNWKDKLIFGGYRQLFGRVAPGCHVISISKSVQNHVEGRLKVPATRSSLLYNAVPEVEIDDDRASLRRELDIPSDAHCVLYVGRLHVLKSLATLLRAAAELRHDLPQLKVLLVGEGPDGDNLRALHAELGLEGVVEFRGKTGRPERYMAAADVFTLPSVSEGFGLVVLEAFRASLPVIVTRIEGPAELVDDGNTGLLVPPNDVSALAQALRTLHGDPAQANRLATAGHQSYRDRYTIPDYAYKLAALYAKT